MELCPPTLHGEKREIVCIFIVVDFVGIKNSALQNVPFVLVAAVEDVLALVNVLRWAI